MEKRHMVKNRNFLQVLQQELTGNGILGNVSPTVHELKMSDEF